MITGLGAIEIRRTYLACDACQEKGYIADDVLGVSGGFTVVARELVCLAGKRCGFATAADDLKRYCGWNVSEQTMRRTCEAEGLRIERWRENAHAASDASPMESISIDVLATIDDTSMSSTSEPAFTGDGAEAPERADRPSPGSDIYVSHDSGADGSVSETVSPAIAMASSIDVTPMSSEIVASPAASESGVRSIDPTPEAARAFREAPGQVEFQTDGAKVNTTTGWREIRLGVWLKRPAGESAEPWQWPCRILPRPTARMAMIDMAESATFGDRWRPWAAALGIDRFEDLSALADGAEWIWKQLDIQYPGHRGVLDIFHAVEKLAEAARQIYPAGSGTLAAWLDCGRHRLLAAGWNGFCEWVDAVRADQDNSKVSIRATESIVPYFANHIGHMDYAARMSAGESIGSGAVEGACKQLVGRRLKQTGARWRPENAIRMATLVSTDMVGDWDLYWKTAANPSLAI